MPARKSKVDPELVEALKLALKEISGGQSYSENELKKEIRTLTKQIKAYVDSSKTSAGFQQPYDILAKQLSQTIEKISKTDENLQKEFERVYNEITEKNKEIQAAQEQLSNLSKTSPTYAEDYRAIEKNIEGLSKDVDKLVDRYTNKFEEKQEEFFKNLKNTQEGFVKDIVTGYKESSEFKFKEQLSSGKGVDAATEEYRKALMEQYEVLSKDKQRRIELGITDDKLLEIKEDLYSSFLSELNRQAEKQDLDEQTRKVLRDKLKRERILMGKSTYEETYGQSNVGKLAGKLADYTTKRFKEENEETSLVGKSFNAFLGAFFQGKNAKKPFLETPTGLSINPKDVLGGDENIYGSGIRPEALKNQPTPVPPPAVTPAVSSPTVPPPAVTPAVLSPTVPPPAVTPAVSSPTVPPPAVTPAVSVPTVPPPAVTPAVSSPIVPPPAVTPAVSVPVKPVDIPAATAPISPTLSFVEKEKPTAVNESRDIELLSEIENQLEEAKDIRPLKVEITRDSIKHLTESFGESIKDSFTSLKESLEGLRESVDKVEKKLKKPKKEKGEEKKEEESSSILSTIAGYLFKKKASKAIGKAVLRGGRAIATGARSAYGLLTGAGAAGAGAAGTGAAGAAGAGAAGAGAAGAAGTGAAGAAGLGAATIGAAVLGTAAVGAAIGYGLEKQFGAGTGILNATGYNDTEDKKEKIQEKFNKDIESSKYISDPIERKIAFYEATISSLEAESKVLKGDELEQNKKSLESSKKALNKLKKQKTGESKPPAKQTPAPTVSVPNSTGLAAAPPSTITTSIAPQTPVAEAASVSPGTVPSATNAGNNITSKDLLDYASSNPRILPSLIQDKNSKLYNKMVSLYASDNSIDEDEAEKILDIDLNHIDLSQRGDKMASGSKEQLVKNAETISDLINRAGGLPELKIKTATPTSSQTSATPTSSQTSATPTSSQTSATPSQNLAPETGNTPTVSKLPEQPLTSSVSKSDGSLPSIIVNSSDSQSKFLSSALETNNQINSTTNDLLGQLINVVANKDSGNNTPVTVPFIAPIPQASTGGAQTQSQAFLFRTQNRVSK